MSSVRVAINGFGTIGKRVARAVQAQPDLSVSGGTKTGPSHGCALAERLNLPLYCTSDDQQAGDKIAKGDFDSQSEVTVGFCRG